MENHQLFLLFFGCLCGSVTVLYAGYTTHIIGYYSTPSPKAQTLQRLFAQNSRFSQNVRPFGRPLCYTCIQKGPRLTAEGFCTQYRKLFLWQHRIIPALRLKHRSGGCRTSLAVSALRIMRYCPILFCFPLREDDFVDKEEDQHQNVTVEHRGSDVIDKVRHQQARNRRSHAVDEVNEAGDQTECQHQAICLARSTSCAGSGIGFLFKAGKTVGFEPKTAAAILPV
ncbi:MAG: hypothetical protein ACLSUC_06760 [Subdoligranulum sp.]